MRTYALVRYDLKDNELNLAGTYLSPEAAQDAAHGFGARGTWAEPGRRALFACDQVLYAKKATWYLSPVEVIPSWDWNAAREAAWFLRRVLLGITTRGKTR